MQLYPCTAAAIKYRAGLVADPPVRGTARRIVRWECPECGELHYCEKDAEDCCPPADAAALSSEPTCPVCGDEHHDHYAAADCCLWKDLDIAARMKVAKDVESGTDWATALNVT